ncbi:DNA polymerase subunit Cdc27-domain-containing protein [Dichotomocladium elegans]|nr:DNA polymerase subunit Cdc27-domain-containing protein [Dichotomocladium elegans]
MSEYLTIAIEQEQRPVTYKLLARTQGMHVNAAKQALWEFLQISQKARAVYCISGKLATDDGDRYAFRLVKDTELEDAKKDFQTITGLHVYSLLPYDPKDLSVLVTASKDIPRIQLADRIKCGVIKSTALKHQAAKRTETAHADANAFLTDKTTTSTTERITSKKTGASTTTASKTAQLGKRDREPSAPKPKQVAPPVAKHPKSVDRQAQKALASSIFSDDEEDHQMKDTSPAAARSEARAMTEDENEKSQADMMETDEPEHNRQLDESMPPAAAPGKVMRKVEKIKEYTDARGYTISEKYHVWEEADAPASAQKPLSAPTSAGREKPTPKSKPGSKKKPEQQQQMLTSWFTKKQ